MSVTKSKGRWRYRRVVTLANGARTRISGTATPNNKASCEAAERLHIERVLQDGPTIGRPPVVDEARTISISIRATAEEVEIWRAVADAAGLSLSEWIRKRANPSTPSGHGWHYPGKGVR